MALVFYCAWMMHLIFRVPGERLISFHTLSVARHYNMYVVHTPILSEAPVHAMIFGATGAPIGFRDRSIAISGPRDLVRGMSS